MFNVVPPNSPPVPDSVSEKCLFFQVKCPRPYIYRVGTISPFYSTEYFIDCSPGHARVFHRSPHRLNHFSQQDLYAGSDSLRTYLRLMFRLTCMHKAWFHACIFDVVASHEMSKSCRRLTLRKVFVTMTLHNCAETFASFIDTAVQ